MWKKLLSLIGIHFVKDYEMFPRRGLLIQRFGHAVYKDNKIVEEYDRTEEVHLVLGFVGFKREWHLRDYDRLRVFCRQMCWTRITYQLVYYTNGIPDRGVSIFDKRRFSMLSGRTPMSGEKGALRVKVTNAERLRGTMLAEGDLCDQPTCPFYGAGAEPKPADFPPCPHMAGARTDWFSRLFRL